MTREKIEAFLEAQTINEISAPKLEYALFSAGEEELSQMEKEFMEKKAFTEADREERERVSALSQPEEILKYMRKSLHPLSRLRLFEKLKENQEALFDQICRKVLTTGLDSFVENAAQFFLRCEKDPCEWILMNYEGIRSEYMKSMLCLVLGNRAGGNLAPFLILETARFQQTAAGNDTFSQGPILGLSLLYERCFRA